MIDEQEGETALGNETDQVSNVGDIVFSLLSTVGGLLVVWHSLGIPSAPGNGPGSGLFPGIIGTFLTAIGLGLGIMTLFRMHRNTSLKRTGPLLEQERTASTSTGKIINAGNQDGSLKGKGRRSNAVAVLAAIVFYILLIEPLGFIITMSSLQLALMIKFKRGILSAIIISLISTLILYFVFDRVLYIPLQTGLLG